MNPRFAAAVIFIAAFIALPLPLLGLDGVVVPAARYWQLAGVLAVLVAIEGTGGMVGLFLGLMTVHAIVYTLLLGGACWGLGRSVLPRIHHRLRDHITVITATLLISLGIYAELYETRFHHSSANAKLLELYR